MALVCTLLCATDPDRFFRVFADGEPSASAGQPPSGAGERQPCPQTDHQQGRPKECSGQGMISHCPSQKRRKGFNLKMQTHQSKV